MATIGKIVLDKSLSKDDFIVSDKGIVNVNFDKVKIQIDPSSTRYLTFANGQLSLNFENILKDIGANLKDTTFEFLNGESQKVVIK